MGGSFPEASTNAAQNELGTIRGSNYGGHAPITGSHVYVLQPNVAAYSSGGYGTQATSLLGSTSTSGYATTLNTSDPGIPTSWYYITTDSSGSFNITGDYTCTVGLPVYLYIYGGSPGGLASGTVTVSSVTVTGSSAPYTVTMTTTNQNAYVGETVTFTSGSGKFTAANITALNGTTQTIIGGSGSTQLSNTSFSFTTSAALTAGTYSSPGGTSQATLNPSSNPAVVNLAILGNCPSTGNFTYNQTTQTGLKYVYVNEVSTVAAAYAFKPFALQSNNSAIYIGTSTTNIAGIQNAANIAGQLYDIQGSNTSTTYAGEGHIARSATTNGNGIVPQAMLDTLGNILAACVDSNNTITAVGTGSSAPGGMSAACFALFSNATNTGIPSYSTGSGANAPGTAPVDTATAAINIARHPGGPPYSYTNSNAGATAFMSALYGAPSGVVPFSPSMGSQPNDFTIGILYNTTNNPGPTTPGIALPTRAESVAIDAIGNAWFTSEPTTSTGYMFEMSPTGVVNTSNTQYASAWPYGYVVVDTGSSAWAGAVNLTTGVNASNGQPVTVVHQTSTATATSGNPPPTYTYASAFLKEVFNPGYPYYAYYTAAGYADSAGDIDFYTNLSQATTVNTVPYYGQAGSVSYMSDGTITAGLSDFSAIPAGYGINHASIDNAGAVYLDYNGVAGGTPQIGRNVAGTNGSTPAAGATASGTWPVTPSTSGCSALTDPEQMTTTRSSDALVPDYHSGTGTLNGSTSNVFYITSAGVCTALAGNTMQAGFYSPYGAATDGNDVVYITNGAGNSISAVNTISGTASGTVSVSPNLGYQPSYMVGSTLTYMLNNPHNVAIGPSGTMWVTNFSATSGSIVEIIGLAAPTTTPTANAAIAMSSTQGSIGYKP